MSLDREYETSKIGPTVTIAFTNTAQKRIRLTTQNRRSFRIRATVDVRVRQGDKDVATSNTGASKGMLLETTYLWRIDVDDQLEAFIAIQGESASGDIEITSINTTKSDDPVVEV